MNPLICSAIRSKLVIHFHYSGGNRSVEPFCYGVTAAGNEVLRGYQTGGHSVSRNPVGWKLFLIFGISNLTITSRQFYAIRPGYNPNDPAMTTIYCHVQVA